MKGLDVTELRLSEVADDNQKLRIDDSFFNKLAVLTQRRVEAMPHARLGDIASVVRKGIFDINADAYTETGVPFVRITNLQSGLIARRNLAHIPPSIHAAESKTALFRGDIVLSKTAYPAAAWVNLDECNTSQDTVAVRLSSDGRKKMRAGAVVAFLNSRHGHALMWRQFQGNVQAHLSLPDAKKLPIPIFAAPMQSLLEQALVEADRLIDEAVAQFSGAEQGLVRALGLADWRPPEPLSYTRRASDVFAAGRIDAEYFKEKFIAARKALVKAGAVEFISLSELATVITNGHTPLRHDLREGDVPFLCAEHVSDFECDYQSDKRILLEHHRTELARTALRNGDLLLSIKGRVGNVAIVENVPPVANINQDVALLRLNDRLPLWWVVTYLNSYFGKLQVEQFSTGGINPFLGLFSIRKLTIPRFDAGLMEQVVRETQSKVYAARAARQKAQALLACTRQATEVAIEQDEAAALAVLSAAMT